MIVPKKSLITLAIVLSTLITTLFLVYFARVAIVKNFSHDELALYDVKITCLDFHLTTDLDLAISHLCLQTPQADINIEDMAITLALAAEQKIKGVDIALITVKGTADLLTLFKSSPQKNNPTRLTAQLKTYLTQLEQLKLPFNIQVAALSYSPFSPENSGIINSSNGAKKAPYIGQFSVIENTLGFSLEDLQHSVLLSVDLSTNPHQKAPLALKIFGQLSPLKQFLFAHKLPLAPAIVKSLGSLNTSGEFYSLLNYQAGQLTLDWQLKDFSLAAQGIKASGPFELSGTLNLHSKINLNKVNLSKKASNKEDKALNRPTELEVEFQHNNSLQLKYSHPHLIDYSNHNALSPLLITLLKDNPVEQLAFQPKGKLAFNLNNQQLSLSGIAIKAESAQQVHQLNLDNLTFNLKHYLNVDLSRDNNPVTEDPAKESPLLAQLNFKLNSPLLLSSINNFTYAPVVVKLQGSISQNHAQTIINLDENSSFTSNKIAMSTNQKTADKKLLSIKQLTTKVQGFVEINHPIQQQTAMQVQNPVQGNRAINLNVKVQSQAEKLRVGKMIAVKKLALSSTIAGNLNNIEIKAKATADNVALGNLTISGPVDKPNIALTAEALPLTDLIALDIELPTKIALVEGTLSYSVKGQVTDLTDFEKTPLAISIAMKSVSGEVDGIWLQELNWQQNFQFLAGKLTTRHNVSKDRKENLTIALIDIPTPVSKLSVNTALSYEKDFTISATKIKGDILGGSFAIPNIQWPLEHGHSVDVQLTSIDLEQVLALDKKQGIVVTGNISGQLPIRYDGEKYTMGKGELHNVTNGLIQVMNNPAVAELKANNSQLTLAFDALQNLHYHQLSSDISMADDGYMLLKTVIKGRNPDIDNDVNLNLNLSYDLLGLLESMSITEQFEERIIQGLQKNKE
ncbi:YdbH domain-containing protein [Colwellia sp. MB3u-70]|uniref:intermembrane phospholipid transport protein YdbH family protein n=1 Tax=unclassified Colwellia TaxID=196834 RepID=UPI0015F4964B|nr:MULTISPECIES: YdbH domain-containing protein [unclassified Colwellia]MBA6290984.1 YdbH domain-containing protein [Colwellia sp. MB3u-8]MBA6308297.1 YdbH domain-containing protein [Colwellia sp. MB3u-70]